MKLESLDFILLPLMFLSGVGFTLAGFKIIRFPAAEKGQEAAQAKMLKFARWAGLFITFLSAVLIIVDIAKLK